MGEMTEADALRRMTTLLEALRIKAIKDEVLPAARQLGVREDALDVVQSRAEAAFQFTASGALRGPDGLTAPGWCRFKLVTESPYLVEAASEKEAAPERNNGKGPSPTDRPETARERLSRANGETSALEAVRWGQSQ